MRTALPVAAALIALLTCGAVRGAAPDGAGTVPARLVVLPSVDLSGGNADRGRIDALLARRAQDAGFDVLPADDVLAFLRRVRLRYTGGVAAETLAALGAELGADAVLVATVDMFEAGPPPRVALNARILATDGRIVSVAEVAESGDDHPGVLALGLIDSIDVLSERVTDRLVATLAREGLADVRGLAAAPGTWRIPTARKRQSPKRVFHEPPAPESSGRTPRVAVLPFENLSARPEAGEVVSGLFGTWLAGRPGLELIEPGDVRDALLRGRVIQEHGLSLAQGDALRELLDADLVVTGRLLDYADFVGAPVPRVAFAVWVLDVRRRVVVWSAYSANRGDDGVAFFEVGRVRSARALASDMVLAAATRLAGDLAVPPEAR